MPIALEARLTADIHRSAAAALAPAIPKATTNRAALSAAHDIPPPPISIKKLSISIKYALDDVSPPAMVSHHRMLLFFDGGATMLKKEREELIAALEQSAEEWPWRGKEVVTVSCTMEEGHAALVDAFGFDDPLKRGLLFVLLMSRSLRLGRKRLKASRAVRSRQTACSKRKGG